MASYPELDLTMPTRHGEEVWLTTASFTNEGVAELVVGHKADDTPDFLDIAQSTIITAKQARTLATALDNLASFWGE